MCMSIHASVQMQIDGKTGINEMKWMILNGCGCGCGCRRHVQKKARIVLYSASVYDMPI